MVVIHNQDEADYLNNMLPNHAKYYWLGILKVGELWTNNRTGEVVLNETQNWAPGEPDDIKGNDCVEIYIKRNIAMGKWNNERCNKKKGVVCYTGKTLFLSHG